MLRFGFKIAVGLVSALTMGGLLVAAAPSAVALGAPQTVAPSSGVTYSGDAYAVGLQGVTVLGEPVANGTIADTGQLPAAGGTLQSGVNVDLPAGLGTVSVVGGSVTGADNVAYATDKVASIDLLPNLTGTLLGATGTDLGNLPVLGGLLSGLLTNGDLVGGSATSGLGILSGILGSAPSVSIGASVGTSSPGGLLGTVTGLLGGVTGLLSLSRKAGTDSTSDAVYSSTAGGSGSLISGLSGTGSGLATGTLDQLLSQAFSGGLLDVGLLESSAGAAAPGVSPVDGVSYPYESASLLGDVELLGGALSVPVSAGPNTTVNIPDLLSITLNQQSYDASTNTASAQALVINFPTNGLLSVAITGTITVSSSTADTSGTPACPSGVSVTSITPTSGSVAGGTPVIISGSGFAPGDTVAFGSTPATDVSVQNTNTIDATSPAHAAGTVTVSVNACPNSPATFTYLTPSSSCPAGISVTSISPTYGPVAGGTKVTIRGSGFASGATVSFGSSSATDVTVPSSTTIDATSPPHAEGAVTISVDGCLTGVGFEFLPPSPSTSSSCPSGLSVVSISPASGPGTGGTKVTITGSGFGSGDTVGFGSTAGLDEAVVSSTTIRVTSPPHASGAVNVTVDGCPSPAVFVYKVSTITRAGGANRIYTAIAVSQETFPQADSAGAVVLAEDLDFSDALAGVPLAHATHAPLLLTEPAFERAGINPAVLSEIKRVLAPGKVVYLLGGPAALSTHIDTQLQDAGYKTVSLAGTTRFGTAVAIANLVGNPSSVFLATGLTFPDALSAGPAAVHQDGVILLTNGTTMAPETAAYIAAHPSDSVFAVGSAAAAADPAATPIVGANEYATNTLVASFFASPTAIGIARGDLFPDALDGGAQVADQGGPVILVNPNLPLPAPASEYFQANAPTINHAFVYGGTGAVTPAVFNAIDAELGG